MVASWQASTAVGAADGAIDLDLYSNMVHTEA